MPRAQLLHSPPSSSRSTSENHPGRDELAEGVLAGRAGSEDDDVVAIGHGGVP